LIILYFAAQTPMIAVRYVTSLTAFYQRLTTLTAKVNKLFDKCEKYTYLCIRYIFRYLSKHLIVPGI